MKKMNTPDNHEYLINISPRILELLGPSLYTNIYYVLAELIANAYDACASNVYIIQKNDSIIVEDDGTGMSYDSGDIAKYLNVGIETRVTSADSLTADGTRKRMGRKGVGKLAALSVSENVWVMTTKSKEKSGFILSRHVGDDHKLKPLEEKDIKFERIGDNGTAIVMTKPQYGLHKTGSAIKKNLLKIFPLVDSKFAIHIINGKEEIIINSFDKEMIEQLGTLVILGDEYHGLSQYYNSGLAERAKAEAELLKKENAIKYEISLLGKKGVKNKYNLQIVGWVGTYRSTKGRKNDPNDFPDNFISLFSNGKLGEYNILPLVGRNYLSEVYIVGQLHIDLFEETELPDIALSNRQGYKTDDVRYQQVIAFVRDDLLPQIYEMREVWANFRKDEKEKGKQEQQQKDEEELRKKVDEYKATASQHASEKIAEKLLDKMPKGVREIIEKEMNEFMPIVGLKRKVDSQKKRILISHTKKDKALSDVIYKMLSFNNVPDEVIIYTSCENAECRIPEGASIFDYLRKFFVESYSTEKILVLYVTSNEMASKWMPVTEVGAGWITKSTHKVFNIKGHKPQKPLDVDKEYHTSKINKKGIGMDAVEFDKFIIKVVDVSESLGYKAKSNEANKKELARYVNLTK